MADTIIKTFQYKIRKNRKFEEAAQKALDDSRFVYNCALEQRILRVKQGRPINFFQQCKDLTEARTLPDIKRCHRKIQCAALERLDFAFRAFFRRLKKGEGAGFPRFMSVGRYNTFSQKIESRTQKLILVGDIITVPGVGKARVRLSRPMEGNPKELLITRRSDGWCALFVCSIDKPEPLPKTGESVGIDLGITPFATLSSGEQIANPQITKMTERKLSHFQRSMDLKKKNGANRLKAKFRFAMFQAKIKRSREDFHYKTALALVRRFDTIKVEDLDIKPLIQSSVASKSISNVGWGNFLRILSYKAENAGREFVKVNPAYTSQTCSACGYRQKMPLSCRTFNCPECGLVLDRDHNAAINIGRGTPKFTPVESPKGRRRSRNNRIEQSSIRLISTAPE